MWCVVIVSGAICCSPWWKESGGKKSDSAEVPNDDQERLIKFWIGYSKVGGRKERRCKERSKKIVETAGASHLSMSARFGIGNEGFRSRQGYCCTRPQPRQRRRWRKMKRRKRKVQEGRNKKWVDDEYGSTTCLGRHRPTQGTHNLRRTYMSTFLKLISTIHITTFLTY